MLCVLCLFFGSNLAAVTAEPAAFPPLWVGEVSLSSTGTRAAGAAVIPGGGREAPSPRLDLGQALPAQRWRSPGTQPQLAGMMSSSLKGKTRRKWNFVPIIEPVFTVVVKYGILAKICSGLDFMHNAAGWKDGWEMTVCPLGRGLHAIAVRAGRERFPLAAARLVLFCFCFFLDRNCDGDNCNDAGNTA